MVSAPSGLQLADEPAQRPAAFDAAASTYDDDFSHRQLGQWLRERVWQVLSRTFVAGHKVLELGCGTGEDATWLAARGVHVLATDASEAMLRIAAAKAEARGVADRVRIARLDLNAPGPVEAFDGAFSNFGALNCVADRRALFQWLAERIGPGGTVVAVVMGPFCAWETAWYVLHGDVPRAVRRWSGQGAVARVADGSNLRVWYPAPHTLAGEAQPHFRMVETRGIGTLLPPSYLADLVDRSPSLFGELRRFDADAPFGPWWADHYLAVFERR